LVTDHSNPPRDATRVPLEHRIQLKFDRFSGFINEYLSNISPGGIFIRTASPEAPGQLLEFEFRLGDGFELIHGRGEVVWSRQQGDGPERPPGMGVRFIELSPGSKDLIYKIVDDYVAHGGKPFDLTPPAAAAGSAAGGAAVGVAGAPSGVPAGTPGGAPGGAADGAPAGARVEQPADSQAKVLAGSVADAAASSGSPADSPAGSGSPARSGWPAESPPRSGSPAELLPWTLDLPPIQPLPGVPAITPRSPLELLGAGGGRADDFEVAARTAAGTRAAAGQAMDPLAQMAASLPPLDELAPEVTGLLPAAAPQEAPAFSSFESRVPVRRSRRPLIAALIVIGVLALSAFLGRDYLLGWLERHEQAQAERTTLAPVAAPARPQGRQQAAAGSSPAYAVAAGAARQPGEPPAPPATGAAAGPGTAAGGESVAASGAPAAKSATAAGAPSAGPVASAGAPAGEAGPPPLVSARSAAGAAPAAAPAGRATAVERITWEASPGATDLVLWGNGDFPPQSYTRTRVTGAPVREVVRITGITRPFASPRLAVRTPQLQQVRTGFHPPQELHVVLDLGGREVEVAAVEAGPRQLRIHLRSR
jgi:uncharacterized protein (TIGR02266 family)